MKLDEPASSWHNTNIGVVYSNKLRMSTPSNNQSSTMDDEDYFVWRKSRERRQQENGQQMQTLFRQTEQLRKENKELQAQMSTVGLF